MSFRNREAFAAIIDLTCSEIKKALEYGKNLIDSKINTRKYDQCSIFLSSTKQTKNELALKEHEYQHVTMAMPCEQISYAHFGFLNQLKVTKEDIVEADIYDAIIVAADHINLTTKNITTVKSHRIIVITDLENVNDMDDMEPIVDSFKESGIILDVVYVDTSDENKLSDSQNMSEVRDYVLKNGGKFQSLETALKNLTYEVQPIPA